jgi:hypothetical protein
VALGGWSGWPSTALHQYRLRCMCCKLVTSAWQNIAADIGDMPISNSFLRRAVSVDQA